MRSGFCTKKVTFEPGALGWQREWQQEALRLQVVQRKVTGPLPRIGVSRVPVEIGLPWTLGPRCRAAQCTLGQSLVVEIQTKAGTDWLCLS